MWVWIEWAKTKRNVNTNQLVLPILNKYLLKPHVRTNCKSRSVSRRRIASKHESAKEDHPKECACVCVCVREIIKIIDYTLRRCRPTAPGVGLRYDYANNAARAYNGKHPWKASWRQRLEHYCRERGGVNCGRKEDEGRTWRTPGTGLRPTRHDFLRSFALFLLHPPLVTYYLIDRCNHDRRVIPRRWTQTLRLHRISCHNVNEKQI